MSWDAWITVVITLAALVALARDWAADLVFMGAIVLLGVLQIITPAEAFSGFVNPGVLMVGAMFIVAAGLRETGVIDVLGHRLLTPARTEMGALLRLATVPLIASAFLNNTPIVAMFIPILLGWCRRNQVAPSRLLIPLSYVTILGGCCTLIGTSTNLVVHGKLKDSNLPGFGFFELSWVGVPCAVVGVVYLLTVGRFLLPRRKAMFEKLGETRREYLVEMVVQPHCRLIGQSIEQAGLRRLPGLFLIEIDRRGAIIGPVSPDTVLEANDRLVFTGVVSTIVDLKKIPGLEPAGESAYDLARESRGVRRLCEAVVSRSSPLVGQTVRDANFRAHYNAAIVAIHRNGERLTSKIGDVRLESGDTLLLQTGPHFAKTHHGNPDFYLVSDVDDSQQLRHEHWWVALLLFALLVIAMVSRFVEPMLAAFLISGLMIATRCLTASDARQSVEWPVLVAIGASFGLGNALEKTGAAAYLAGILVDFTQPFGPYATLAAIYLVTMVLNELITNNGAAALAFPFCLKAAELSGCNTRPFVVAVTMAASLAFSSPIGYQTHMMVFGPGGYRFSDFVRAGVPLNVLLWAVCVALIPLIWPF